MVHLPQGCVGQYFVIFSDKIKSSVAYVDCLLYFMYFVGIKKYAEMKGVYFN